MKVSSTFAVATLALIGQLACSGAARGDASLESFQAFWKTFRASIVDAKPEVTASLVEFPLRTRGPLDDDPLRELDRAAFLGSLERLLAQDPGLAPEPETMKALIARTETPSASLLSDGGKTARLGAFVFSNTGAGWRLTMVYTDE